MNWNIWGGVNDGEVAICRYFDNNSEIQTLIGIYSKIDDIVTVSIFQNDNGINLIDLLPKKEDKTNLS